MRLASGGALNRHTSLRTASGDNRLPKLNDSQPGYMVGGGGGGAPSSTEQHRVTRLEAEVQRLEAKGMQLVKRVGEELEGVALLEKALQARARFPSLQQEPWSYGEQFVMVCNQLAVRVMQRLDDHYEPIANELLAAAERALTSNVNDPFAGFHPLRQALLSATLTNYACLQRIRGEDSDVILKILQRCINVETDGRLTSRTLFNLAAGYTTGAKFDEAAETVSKSVALANHHLTLPLTFPGGGNPLGGGGGINSTNSQFPPGIGDHSSSGGGGSLAVREHYRSFQSEEAHMAILGHHMIASIAVWTGGINIARHHAKLALRCAETYLGDAHALTTRCLERLSAVQSDDWDANFDEEDDVCPSIPLQMVTFTGSPLSATIPFTLVSSPPPQVMQNSIPVNTAAAVAAANGQEGKLPPINGQRLRSPTTSGATRKTLGGPGGGGYGSPSPKKKSTMPNAVQRKKESVLLSRAKAKSAFASEPGATLGEDGVLIPAPLINDLLTASKVALEGGQGLSSAEDLGPAPGSARGVKSVSTVRPVTHTGARPKPPGGAMTPLQQTTMGGRGLGATRGTTKAGTTPAASSARGPGTFHSESAEKTKPGHNPRPPLRVRQDVFSASITKGGERRTSATPGATPGAGTSAPITPLLGDPDIEVHQQQPQSIPTRRPDSRDSLLVAPTSFATATGGGGLGPVIPHPPRPVSHTRTRRFSQTPNIPTVSSHRVTTVIPKKDYERYMSIQEEVDRAITEGSAVPGTRAVQTGTGYNHHHGGSLVPVSPAVKPSPGSSMSGSLQQQQLEQIRSPNPVSNSGALRSQHFHPHTHSSPHSQLGRGGSPPLLHLVHRDDAAIEFEDLGDVLRVGNEHLRELSTIIPDHTAEEEALWQASTYKIQRQWRITKSRIKVRRVRKAVQQQILREQKALVIQDFFQRNMAQSRARLVCGAKRHERLLKSYATLIAAYCRRWTSVDVQGGIYLKWLEAEKERWDIWHRRECAATVVQSVFRSHSTRGALRKQQNAAEVLQRTWRLFRLYNGVRMEVFRRRDNRRTVARFRDRMAIKLQQWAMLHVRKIRAKAVVDAQRQKIKTELELLHQREHRYWEQLKTVDEAACSMSIQNMCRRYSTFQKMATVWWENEKQRIAAAHAIQRWFRFLTASRVAGRWKQRQDQKRRIQRRKEEVLEAVIDVQKVVRGFMERRRYGRKLDGIAASVAAALTLQRFSRRLNHRREYHRKQKDRQWAEERYLIAQHRTFSATKIQAVFRSHKDRDFCRDYRGFMSSTRHEVAQKIQRTVRWWLARKQRATLHEQRAGGVYQQSLLELKDCCAQRIQKTWRMHHQKSQMYDVIFAPTVARRKAATLFQRAWRKYACGERVRRLQLQRQATLQSTINSEHMIYYVIQLQTFARRFILTPNKVVEQNKWVRVRAATRIQSLFRGFRDRKRVRRIRRSREMGANEKYEEEEVVFAAIRIQKVWRGFEKRNIYRLIHLSARKISYFFRSCLSRRKTQALRNSRKLVQESQVLREQDDAARTIQVSWRYGVWRKAYWVTVAAAAKTKQEELVEH